MRSVKRGIKSILFYWKSNLLFSTAFLMISVILLIMASIQRNVDAAIEETGKRVGAELTIRVKDTTALSYDKNIYYSQETGKKLEAWEEVQELNYIALANARGDGVEEVFSEMQQIFKEASEENGNDYYGSEARRNAGEITVIGINELEKAWEFEKRGVEVTQGEGISQENNSEAVAVVSERFLEWNMLKIGDEIALVNALDSASTMKVKVIGTHSDNYASGDVAGSAMNHIYVPLKECLKFNGGKVVQTMITIKNPENTKTILNKMQTYLDKTDTKFTIQEDSMMYLTAITPLKGVQKVCLIMFYITFGILLLILLLIVGRRMLNLRKEIGIWVALGEKKSILFVQSSIEILGPIFGGIIAGNLLALIFEQQFGLMLARVLRSFPDIAFRMSRTAIWQIAGVTFTVAMFTLMVLFLVTVRKKATDLFREG